MDYDALLAHVIAFLQQEKRLAYRVLKRRLQLDDDVLEDLKDDLIYAKKLAVDEEGKVLVWTGGADMPPSTTAPTPQPAAPFVPQEARFLGGCPRISTSGSLNPRKHVERMPDSSLPWTSPGLCNAMAAPQRHDALQRAISSP
jgi:hypothetical protein